MLHILHKPRRYKIYPSNPCIYGVFLMPKLFTTRIICKPNLTIFRINLVIYGHVTRLKNKVVGYLSPCLVLVHGVTIYFFKYVGVPSAQFFNLSVRISQVVTI